MRVDDLTVEVRDRTLKRVGQVTPLFLDLKARTKWCAVGEWTLTLPGDHAMVEHLSTPGSGILLLGPDGTADNVVLSGPTRIPARVRNLQNPDGTFTFSGVTDEILLAGSLAFPDPGISDPQASSQSRSNDTRTGTTEDLLRTFVSLNMGPGAPAGRLRGLRQFVALQGASAGRGVTQQKSPRFQNLLELLQEMVTYDPTLGFRVVQVGSALQFQVLDSRDRSKFVRFDIENGTIASEEVQTGGPVVTDAIVAGQGEGTERTIVRRQDAEAVEGETLWGIPFETFVDQRDTDDLQELEQSGDEALSEGRGGTAVKMVPADDTTMEVGADWRSGDLVTTVVGGVETVARVTEVAYLVNADGVRAGAALGDVSGFTAKDAESATVEGLDSRVSRLERASAGPVTLDRLPRSALLLRGTTAERDDLYGVPATAAQRSALANQRVTWFNTDLGWEESYFARTDTAGLSVPGLMADTGVTDGWYPTGEGPWSRHIPAGAQSMAAGTWLTNYSAWGSGASGGSTRRGGAAWFTYNAATGQVVCKRAGIYDVVASALQQAGAGTTLSHLMRDSNSVQAVPNALNSSYATTAQFHLPALYLRENQMVGMWSEFGSYQTFATTSASEIRGQLVVRYKAPALVSE